MIIFNKVYEKIFKNFSKKTCSIPEGLLHLLNNGFVTHYNGCIFFRDNQPVDDNTNDINFFDKTEQECYYNHLRISDFAKENIGEIAVNFTELIALKLHEQIPEKQFEVVTTFDYFEGTVDAVIKIHTLRSNEAPYVDLQNLNDYQQPILIVRTS